MSRLTYAKRATILQLRFEGNSICAFTRSTGAREKTQPEGAYTVASIRFRTSAMQPSSLAPSLTDDALGDRQSIF